jgi:hypothetical protein
MVEVELEQFLRKLDEDLEERRDFSDKYPSIKAGLVVALEQWQQPMKGDIDRYRQHR